MDLKKFLEFDFNNSFNMAVSPSSKEQYKHYCYKKFYYHKVANVKGFNRYHHFFKFGHVNHSIFQAYDETVCIEYFGNLLKDVRLNRKEIIKKIVNFCIMCFPSDPEYRHILENRYYDHFYNFALFEYDRMLRINAIYDLWNEKIFNRYYVPVFAEKQQNQLALDHGISYRLDICFRLCPGYFDNEKECYCIGDYKTGFVPYSVFNKVPRLSEKIKEQMTYPAPWLYMGRDLDSLPAYCIGIYTKKPLAFVYEPIIDEDLMVIYNDLKDIERSLYNDDFPRTYRNCKYCDYKYVCLMDETLPVRLRWRLKPRTALDKELDQILNEASPATNEGKNDDDLSLDDIDKELEKIKEGI